MQRSGRCVVRELDDGGGDRPTVIAGDRGLVDADGPFLVGFVGRLLRGSFKKNSSKEGGNERTDVF
jgi:hypothetical protein